jgi:acetyltransferase-like isoleucine patch superfamily enzyme
MAVSRLRRLHSAVFMTALVARVRLLRRASVRVHPTARVGRIHLSGRGRRGYVSIGEGSRIESGVVIELSRGGRIIIGDNVHVRRGAVLEVSGTLELRGDNLLSWFSVVHCQEQVVFEELAGTGEAVTVVDGRHFHGEAGEPDEHWYHNSAPAPVFIGRNTWLAAKSTVGAGVTLAEGTTVAAHAFVSQGTYPKGAVLKGIPARATVSVEVRPAAAGGQVPADVSPSRSAI